MTEKSPQIQICGLFSSLYDKSSIKLVGITPDILKVDKKVLDIYRQFSRGPYYMSHWITPEEMERKKEMKKRMMTVSIPLFTILVTILITVIINGL